MEVDSQTQLIGLIGHPVSHSRSPQMHNAMFQKLGLNYTYLAFDVLTEYLKEAIEGMRALNIKGFNVTIPHKVNVMKYLDQISEEAKRIGAVNTIVNDKGQLIGYNTDGEGYLRSLVEETDVQLKGKRVLMIGAGGAARAIGYTLANTPIEQLSIINRDQNKAHILRKDLEHYAKTEVLPMEQIEKGVKEADIIVNTTSIGMSPNIDQSLIDKEWIQPHQLVSDIIYNPLETKLIHDARSQGASVHSGLGMFVYQGVIAFEKWTGVTPDPSYMKKKVIESINEKGRN
ncbi:shikimate dehydrogenase [Tepidibacillus fermentans]|uniref:Shikimate dehydrogenase (NADP(+)) n=1 Tax=Tepidibacillus fermentans TaxID=1281767 RepID=A0A4R3KJC8_9BACI|nr:shikimate dehydrogenase [Tepidibacillus fermentans]TCS83786.1 shikimate dehydrogenase [Tepidibacillus fermentans]